MNWISNILFWGGRDTNVFSLTLKLHQIHSVGKLCVYARERVCVCVKRIRCEWIWSVNEQKLHFINAKADEDCICAPICNLPNENGTKLIFASCLHICTTFFRYTQRAREKQMVWQQKKRRFSRTCIILFCTFLLISLARPLHFSVHRKLAEFTNKLKIMF